MNGSGGKFRDSTSVEDLEATELMSQIVDSISLNFVLICSGRSGGGGGNVTIFIRALYSSPEIDVVVVVDGVLMGRMSSTFEGRLHSDVRLS